MKYSNNVLNQLNKLRKIRNLHIFVEDAQLQQFAEELAMKRARMDRIGHITQNPYRSKDVKFRRMYEGVGFYSGVDYIGSHFITCYCFDQTDGVHFPKDTLAGAGLAVTNLGTYYSLLIKEM